MPWQNPECVGKAGLRIWLTLTPHQTLEFSWTEWRASVRVMGLRDVQMHCSNSQRTSGLRN